MTDINHDQADELTRLAADLATTQEHLEKLAGEEALIKARIRELTDGPDKYAAGNLTIVIATNHRFNERKALGLIPEPLLPLVTRTEQRIDKDKLKVLAPDVYAAATDHYDDRVSVR